MPIANTVTFTERSNIIYEIVCIILMYMIDFFQICYINCIVYLDIITGPN